ncbi:hypothetical protein GPECTOR_2088g1082 [Gonium pectorale]|uniref:Uncharacterized protein n=1 Tax=Gonium pectorale TaxID=33097 RepID=A0A150FTB1_GONPE|nr:hypothetical protein GPECTOR_2088g1082 [Gonium pectorale]|eukprot:KXZ40826.1 hypothetical protein GPECTOR_2088g1082 [Gonium pectorale]
MGKDGVDIPVLNESNWPVWSSCVRGRLVLKDYDVAIDKPESPEGIAMSEKAKSLMKGFAELAELPRLEQQWAALRVGKDEPLTDYVLRVNQLEAHMTAAGKTFYPCEKRQGKPQGRWQGNPKPKEKLKLCYICRLPDHLQASCPKASAQQKGGVQPGAAQAAGPSSSNEQQSGSGYRRQMRVAAAAVPAAAAHAQSCYILDSGCGQHITTDAADLWDPEPCSEVIQFGGGAVGQAVAKGKLVFMTPARMKSS